MLLSLLSLSGTMLHLLPVSLSLFGSLVSSLRSRSHFRRYRERRVPFSCFALPDPFSCFALPDPFSAAPLASSPVFMFSNPDSFSAVSTASGPVFMFCASGLIFGSTDGVGCRFHVLRPRTRFHVLRSRTRFHVLRSRRRVPLCLSDYPPTPSFGGFGCVRVCSFDQYYIFLLFLI
jgi:hypothetical protein